MLNKSFKHEIIIIYIKILKIIYKIFKINDILPIDIEEVTEEALSDLKDLNPELWDSIRAYNRSTGNRKQIYFKNKYICTLRTQMIKILLRRIIMED